MAMTRKHYQAIAEALGEVHAIELAFSYKSNPKLVLEGAITGIADRLGSIFEADNPNFDWDKFNLAIETEFQETLERMP